MVAPASASDLRQLIRRGVEQNDRQSGLTLGRHLFELVQKTRSLLPILGHLIHINEKPFTLELPPMFEIYFDIDVPPRTLLRTGRQVGKSSAESCKTIVLNSLTRYFNTLTVLPQFELTQRFSNNYIRPMIEYSPIGRMIIDETCVRNVLQRSFANRSILHFSYAGLSADRCRGIPADRTVLDEAQDIDPDLLGVIEAALARSKWRIRDYAGTPKTMDCLLEHIWQESTQSEWHIPCSCGYTNVPRTDADALNMIGLKTLVCAKCQKPLNANEGYWYHHEPEQRNYCLGLHIPQIIMPIHYESEKNWFEIRRAFEKESKATFLNEFLGEGCDLGTKLVTKDEIKKASRPHLVNEYEVCRRRIMDYHFRVLGVDWGGRGEDRISRTKAAVIGLTPRNKAEVIWGEDMTRFTDESTEILRCMKLMTDFKCQRLAHDAGGSGGVHDALLTHAKIPRDRLMPMVYSGSWMNDLVVYHDPTEWKSWPYWSVDKSRAIAFVCFMIKSGWLFFNNYEATKELTHDFLALVEHKKETARGGDIYSIRRNASMSDDFVHAVTFGTIGAYHSIQFYPDLADHIWHYGMTKEQAEELDPVSVHPEALKKHGDGYLL